VSEAGPQPPSTPAEVAAGLRAQALGLAETLARAGRPGNADPALGAMMEIGFAGVTVSVFATNSGDGSLYVSTGGGVIGGGAHEAVRAAARAFVAAVGRVAARMAPSRGDPPEAGQLVIHAVTPGGLRETRGPLAEYVEGANPMANLFALGNAVFTQLRLVSERMGPPKG
jgi:hypothetical protein